MIEKKNKGFCFQCNKDVDFEIKIIKKKIEVRGIFVECEIKQAFCPICGELVYNKNIEKENDIKVYDLYKKEVNLLTSQEIIKIRKRRNMSQKDLADFLSIGEKDITRYENGSIQTKNIDKMIRLVDDDIVFERMKTVFEKNKVIHFDLLDFNIKEIIETSNVGNAIEYKDVNPYNNLKLKGARIHGKQNNIAIA